jgi:hypothetical protein
MHSQKFSYRFAFMPIGSVNIQPDCVATKAAIKVPQHLEESISVAAFRLDHSSTAQKRSHPAGNVQSLLMLTRCRNLQPFSNERPTASKPRMQSKTAFILKNNGFLRTQRCEFFLGSWRISSRPQPLLGDRYNWLASADTPVDASSTEPDGLSVLFRIGVVNESPMWGRPNGHGLIRTSGVIPQDAVLSGLRSSGSSEQDDPAAFSGSGHLPQPCLLPASSGLCSSGSDREPQKSSQNVVPQEPTRGWRSLSQSMRQGLSRPRPTTALLMPYQGSTRRDSCLPV